MPAPLLPESEIPKLLERCDLPMIQNLRKASKQDTYSNDWIEDDTSLKAFQRLAAIGLIDPAEHAGKVIHWTMNGNGARVLRLWDSQHSPNDDAPPDERAKWIPT